METNSSREGLRNSESLEDRLDKVENHFSSSTIQVRVVGKTIGSFGNSISDGPKNIEMAARATRGRNTYLKHENTLTDYAYIISILKSGHMSILEHVQLTFRIEGISRSCSHQFVRNRIGVAYTQESQRYTDPTKGDWYKIPLTIQKNKQALKIFLTGLKNIEIAFNELNKLTIPLEDARFLLPNATLTNFVYSANIRALFTFFEVRICSRAQWEIRNLAIKIFQASYREYPEIFDFWKPRCGRGCPEACKYKIESFYNKIKAELVNELSTKVD